MMHRVLADWDVVISVEYHIPGLGGSLGPLLSLLGGLSWKTDDGVHMGFLGVKPMGQGHDGGMGRPHILVIVPVDPSGGAASVALSLLCTALSSIKPQFTSHTVQVNAGGMLPVCAEVIPFIGCLSTTACGAPVDLPNTAPIVPTQISVWTGLSWGDIIGGIVNIACDMAWSAITWGIGNKIKIGADFIENGLTKSQLLKRILGNNVVGLVLKALGITGSIGDINFATGPTNIGALAQQAIDGDNVTSDAPINVGIFGFGASWSQSSGNTGRSDGGHFMHWFSE